VTCHTANATATNLNLQLNGDTAANYVWRNQDYSGNQTSYPSAALSTGQTSFRIGTVPSDTEGSAIFSATMGDILFYSVPGSPQIFNSQSTYGTTATMFKRVAEGSWNNTVIVSSLKFLNSTGNFSTGSLVNVYGRS
jgi:hypothetical protein